MKVLTVIPLAKNAFVDELTYFSVREASLGALVEITLRGKPAMGIVVASKDAGDMKALLRGGNFQLKKIGATAPRACVTPAFIHAAQETARYHATQVGPLLHTLLPLPLLDGALTAPEVSKQDSKRVYEAYALQATEAERFATYRNVVRERFAKKESVLLIAPNAQAAQKLADALATGIANYVYTHTSKLTPKKLSALWEKLQNETHPVVVVVTPGYGFVPRGDIGCVVIEQATASGYRQQARPFADTRVFFEHYAHALQATLIWGETVLPTRIHTKLLAGTAHELEPLRVALRTKTQLTLVDTRTKDEDTEKKKPFSPIAEDMLAHIRDALAEDKRVLVLAPRRGLAPLTVCWDCKTTVTCDTCDAPVTLHTTKAGAREFLCKKCGTSKNADTTCAYCDSWRLDTLGIGIELVSQTLAEAFPDVQLTHIDKATCKTDKQVATAAARFAEQGGLLVTTQLGLPYTASADLSLVASLDALLGVPDFSIDETVFRLLLRLKELTRETVFVQTRLPERSVLSAAASGNIADFMREELALRKALKYPPYTVMLRLTKTGTKKKIIEEFQKIMPLLEPYGPRVFKQFERVRPNVFALHCLLRIEAKKWPDDKLVELLKTLQPAFTVQVNAGGVI